MSKAKIDHISVTIVDKEATTNEEKYKKADLYGKSATALLNAVKNSPYLSTRVADVDLTQKSNPASGETAKGYLANVKFFDAADGTRVDEAKDRRYKVDLDKITLATTNKEGKEYTVSKPVYRDRETGTVTNLEDGKVPGVKTILGALNEDQELFVSVDKADIEGKDVWVITDAKPWTAPTASQKADQPRYAITVALSEDGNNPKKGHVLIAGPEIKDSEELKNYIKNDLGGKWNKDDKAWEAPLPEGMTAAKMFYNVIDKARELGVKPSPEAAMKDIAAGAPAGSTLKDAANAMTQKQKAPGMKA